MVKVKAYIRDVSKKDISYINKNNNCFGLYVGFFCISHQKLYECYKNNNDWVGLIKWYHKNELRDAIDTRSKDMFNGIEIAFNYEKRSASNE